MKREQAVSIIKQVLDGSSYAHFKGITLLLHPKNGLSTGYQIQLETRFDQDLEPHIRQIAKDNGLAVAKDGVFWVIYRPRGIEQRTFSNIPRSVLLE